MQFILTKEQHQSLTADWKKYNQTTWSAEDHLIYLILRAAKPDIQAKVKKAFSPSKTKTPPLAPLRRLIKILHRKVIHHLNYEIPAAWTLFYSCQDLNREQLSALALVLQDLAKKLDEDGGL